ncbi:EpsG family protein [Enterococcus sp. 22-H-5-01]|uniref:EpsG family protein n=1 Tax=Enterococcus sp. 22-H-5-01 TaxID=3418555 RepID=UPI003D013DC3
MVIYIILLSILIITLFFSVKQNNVERFLYLFLVSILVMIAIFRANTVGMDVSNYERIFSRISNQDILTVINNSDGSIIYDVYNKLLSMITTNVQVVTITNSAIIIIANAYFIRKMSKNPLFSLFLYYTLYFYAYNLTAARQSIAISLCLISVCFLFNGKKKSSLLLNILAIGVHNTAIVGLVYQILCRINWTNKKYIFLAIISTIGMTGYSFFIKLFLIIFPRYIMYFNGGQYSISDVGEGKKIFVTFFYLFVLLALFIFYRAPYSTIQIEEKIFSVQISAMIIAVVIGVIFYNNLLISRIEVMFSFYAIVFIPNVYKLISKRLLNNVYSEFILIYFSLPIYIVIFLAQILSNINEIVPYSLFW